MSLISRINHLLVANAHHTIDQAESPEVMLKQVIRDMDRNIHEARYVWLYVAAILAYGVFSTVGKEISIVPILALNTTTGLLHYYFDSFIWRVRRSEFRERNHAAERSERFEPENRAESRSDALVRRTDVLLHTSQYYAQL